MYTSDKKHSYVIRIGERAKDKIVYNKDFLADTGYSRMDMDPYSTAWV